MIKCVFSVLLVACSISLSAQKPVLDTAALAVWPTIDHPLISPDGRYISYTIHTPRTARLIYLQSTDGDFKIELGHGEDCDFTADSKKCICLVGDSLCVVDLVSRKVEYRVGVASYKVPEEGNGRYLSYLTVDQDLIIDDLYSGSERRFPHVQEYEFDGEGKALVYQGVDSIKSNVQCSWLKLINLLNDSSLTLCRGARTSNVSFNTRDGEVAFIASDWTGRKESDVRLYKQGMDSGTVVVDNRGSIIEPGFHVFEDRMEFSPDGKKLFFTLKYSSPIATVNLLGANVDVWNYKDEFPHYAQSIDRSVDHLINFKAVLIIESKRVIRLEQETDGGGGIQLLNMGGNANFFLTATKFYAPEEIWRQGSRPSLFLVNTDNGARKQIAPKGRYNMISFSPDGKFVLWFDEDKRAYFTYNIRTETCKNISIAIPCPLTNEQQWATYSPFPYGILQWLAFDSAVLIYDRYDLWSVDPEGKKAPVDLTNGFGRRHKIQLRGVYTLDKNWQKGLVGNGNEMLTLCSLDDSAKENGFYAIDLRHTSNPIKLLTSPFFYYFSGISLSEFPTTLCKAKKADQYLLTQSNTGEYPNLVLTRDFKTFKSMTNLEPQHNYNWLTAELIRWKTFSGHIAEGILYKPEDFDPRKKYPILFYYYERESDGLHLFHPAGPAEGSINIPWFVSRGYLVCSPDISYTIGDVGAGVYDYVVSAANFLTRKSWVDHKRMGLQGHSFGGFETNYLVTRTKLFSAAVTAMGASNLIDLGDINDVYPEGFEVYLEYGQMMMIYPFWQRPDLYIRNSPIFHVDKIVTPLLLVANKEDYAVPWQQGEELFMALRRLGKPVWLLQYTPDGHFVHGGNALDCTIRMTQFFDHYLKGRPEPKWMRESIPARVKGVVDGLTF